MSTESDCINSVSKKYKTANFQKGFATKAVRAGFIPSEELEQSPTIHLTAAYHYKSAEHTDQVYGVYADPIDANDYSRTANPTNEIFEKRMAALEGAEAGLACSSGIHAAFLAICTKASAGDHIVCARIVYGNTVRLLEKTLSQFGITVSFVDQNDVSAWEGAIQKNTKVFFLESPTNPTVDVVDIETVCVLARNKNIFSIVDNTIATPVLQNPISLGADTVVHSATKYIDGQGRAVGGIVLGKQEFITEIRTGLLRTVGGCLSPFHGWIYVKSLETLKIRVEEHSRNALKIAEFLENHQKIKNVKYPFLKSHPQYDVAKKQMKAGGGLIFFEVEGGLQSSEKIVDNVQMISLIGNMGDTQTIIGIPSRSSHSRVCENQRKDSGIGEGCLRLSVGLEDVEDIIADLEQVLERI